MILSVDLIAFIDGISTREIEDKKTEYFVYNETPTMLVSGEQTIIKSPCVSIIIVRHSICT